MKSSVILILSLILLSCTPERTKVDSLNANGKESLRNSKPPKLYYVDFNNEECKRQIQEAIRDIKNNQLSFIDPQGWSIIRYEEEIEVVLQQFNIAYKITGPNCTLEQECYGNHMDSIIHSKYGVNFISEIRQKSDSLFLSKWETKIYEYWDIDESPSYSEYPTEDFLKEQIKFPNGWDAIPIKFERQYLTVEFTISNEGKLLNWKHGESLNIKDTNQRFIPGLRKQIESIVAEMKIWDAGILDDKLVNSIIWVDVNLDKE